MIDHIREPGEVADILANFRTSTCVKREMSPASCERTQRAENRKSNSVSVKALSERRLFRTGCGFSGVNDNLHLAVFAQLLGLPRAQRPDSSIVETEVLN